MFGYDVLLSGAADTPTYRYLKLSWPAGGGANLGFADIRFYANGTAYPPPMTANNAPWPYVATASSVEGNQAYYQPYCAFDSNLAGDFTQSGSGAGWIQLDCGAGFGISPDTVTLRPRDRLEVPAGPITLAGSNDGVSYETLCVITNPVWSAGVTNSYPTGRPGAALAVRTVLSAYQTTATQSYTVPAGVSLVVLKLWGAGGGRATSGMGPLHGGPGGYLYCEVPVVAGDVLTFTPGGRGENYNERGGAPNGGTSGSGQGNGGRAGPNGGTGGGRTEVYKNGTLIAVAPGGGGAGGSDGYGGQGGVGGGLTGGDAPNSNDSVGGKGGTQTGPGAAGSPGTVTGATAGNDGTGGNGANSGAGNGGGGGGGGYFGGGGGGAQPAGQDAGGGGGSAWSHPTLTKNASTMMGSGWTPPNTSDPAYTGTAGYGGYSGNASPDFGLAVLFAA